ncbi:MAG: RNA polymerase factor sigma-54 [Verrucomicrobiota bacterium]|jgi:RNA polymerase sigma-54 factor|nr:RNA polymerase factor sigma-54 [Verrucomicrobiota bacterium]MDP7048773.1 RNA polymerase factor sigma-54 [Verrucomicrobiota bacterium]
MAQQGFQMSQKMSLNQVLAPQLQQSLNLLQAPMLELKAMVDQELQLNPVLEEQAALDAEATEKGELPESAESKADLAEPPSDTQYDPTDESSVSEPVDDFQKEINQLLELDQEWRDHFSRTSIPSRNSKQEDEKRQFMLDSVTASQSLQEFLLEQARLSDFEEEQFKVAELVIGNIDDTGFLQSSVDELVFSSGRSSRDIESVLDVVQAFHPPGVGARDLRECLMLQLERAGRDDSLEYRIIRDCMDELGRRRIREISRKIGDTVDAVQDAVERISNLEPKPGREYLPESNQFVVPEIFISRGDDGGWQAVSNSEYIPRLRISNAYKDLMAQATTSGDVRDYIRDKIRSGKFLLKSIHQRQSTIMNIVHEILKRQGEFMEHGASHLRPMTMSQVADAVGVHETTVSRAVSGKYVETPHGVLEMKYFFTSGLASKDGSSLANTSVKEMLGELVKKEDATKPLSDEDLVKLFNDKGIKIARRTVAKYRAELNILPSHLRRVY